MNRLLHYHWRCGRSRVFGLQPLAVTDACVCPKKDGLRVQARKSLPLELKSPFWGWTVLVNSLGKQRMQAIFANSSCTFQSPFQSTCKSINPFTLHHSAAKAWLIWALGVPLCINLSKTDVCNQHSSTMMYVSSQHPQVHITCTSQKSYPSWSKPPDRNLTPIGLKAWTTEGLQQQPKRSKAWRKRSNRDWMQSCGTNKDTSSLFIKSFECRLKVSNLLVCKSPENHQ